MKFKEINTLFKALQKKQKIILEIRKKYDICDEIAILRQRDTKPDEFNKYYEFVEQCKSKYKD